MSHFPLTMRNARVQMRCMRCVQEKNPEAYQRGSAWIDYQESRFTAERMA